VILGANIAFFGSSLVSAYWNGAATYYRGLIRALNVRGHRVTFYEPDACDRQKHRDMPDPHWARVVVYSTDGQDGVVRSLEAATSATVIIKASGIGVFDDFLERAVLDLRTPGKSVVFWDVDAPATLERVENDPSDPFRALIPEYDCIFTYGGGTPVVKAYLALGAKRCVPIYNALDPLTHHPARADSRFAGLCSFLGNRRPDREARVRQFFIAPAETMNDQWFVLGGNGWDRADLPANVVYAGHVYTRDHNAFNRSATAVLNITRDSMARFGYSPATRVFEAAGAGACLITDLWEGIEMFLEPGREVLVASSGDEVAEHLRALTSERARAMGERAMRRILNQHTYTHRAVEVEAHLDLGKLASARRAKVSS
jgi:spore maturation protein CgeB